ncbi:hypothetical protein PBY51_022153 [Eleginops maclovinus]|uniref:Beta/gamma crystallin 'Greek key' domain-containing protein n=1 Tax=Eleginops maclovinus TaxID=56733 RepID=A0AAN7XGY2_ELEMC|nr:hypothetical protein PBY51_022153 [Eleginops maclovinus]
MAQGKRGIMGKIIFYEEMNFSGRHLECSEDYADLRCLLKQCNSIRVESGCFMIYDQPNFSGNQYCLKRGEYPDSQYWMGTDTVFSVASSQPMPGRSACACISGSSSEGR